MFIDKPSWDTFNEGGDLQNSIERYRKQMDYCPKEVLADKIYCTRANRKWLAEKKHKVVGSTSGTTGSGGIVKPCKTRRPQSDRRKIGAGKIGLWFRLYQSQAQSDLRIIDCLHSLGA